MTAVEDPKLSAAAIALKCRLNIDDTDLVETLYRPMPNRMREVIGKGGH